MALIWLAIAIVLLILEVTTASFEGLMVAAVAALLLSILTALVSLPPLLQVAFFVALTVIGTAWITRWSSRRTPSSEPFHLQEEHAEVIASIPAGGQGRVRWRGQSWSAVSLDPAVDLNKNDVVMVMGREGTQLQVLPQSQ